MPVCERVGARIFYEGRGDGPPVLLVHGGLHEPMSASRFWTAAGVTDALIAAGHRVIVPDRRWSPAATEAPVVPHTWMLEGEDLAAVLRHAETRRAVLVAGSSGCSAALRLAIDASDLVAGLVLAWPVGPRHSLLEAEGLAKLVGAPPPGAGFPESPSPEFPAVLERFDSEPRKLLAGVTRPTEPPRLSGSPAATARKDEPGQHESPEQ